MVVLFIVVANQVIQCIGAVACGDFSPVELVRLWQIGALEIMFEGIMGGRIVKIYTHKRGKISGDYKDREDKIIDEDE